MYSLYELTGDFLTAQEMLFDEEVDTETILNACRETGAVVTCENHHLIGGLGSEIATLLMQNDIRIPMTRVGIGDRYGEVGKEAYLAEVMHLTEQDIIEKTKEAVSRKK